MTVEPVFVIVLPASTAKLVAVPKRGWVAANAAIGHKPTTNAETTIDSAITGRWILFIDLSAPLSPLWSEIRRAYGTPRHCKRTQRRTLHRGPKNLPVSSYQNITKSTFCKERAPEQDAVGPVLPSGAQRQQVPGSADVGHRLRGRDATPVQEIARIHLAHPPAVARGVAGRRDDRTPIGEDDADHSVTEWRRSVPNNRYWGGNAAAGVNRPNEHPRPEFRHGNLAVRGRDLVPCREADRATVPSGKRRRIVALEVDRPMRIDGSHDVFRRRPGGDVVESERLSLRLQQQRSEQLGLLQDPAVVSGGEMRSIKLLVTDDGVKVRGVLRPQSRNLLRRLRLVRHADHRRSAKPGWSNRVDQAVFQLGRRERLRAPAVLYRPARGQGQQDEGDDQTAHGFRRRRIQKGPVASEHKFRISWAP